MDQKRESLLADIERVCRSFLESEADEPTLARVEAEDLARAIPLTIPRRGVGRARALGLLEEVGRRTPRTATHGFFNQLFGGRDDMAVVGEVLAVLANNSMYTYKAAGPHVLIERELIRHMGDLMGFGDCEGVVAPGGSLSNLIGMLVARDQACEGAGDRGLGDRVACVYTSEDSHYSVPKAAALLGLGREQVRWIGVDGRGRMRVDLLRAAIERDLSSQLTPCMINATAGTTVPGAFDPIREIAGVARELGVWLHVDAAFGGSVVLSERRRHLLDGVEHADSIAWDAHKMMGVPLTCSVVLFRERGRAGQSLSEQAEYLFQQDDDELNPGTRSLQCGRRNDALKLWALWQEIGDEGFASRIERLFELCAYGRGIVDGEDRLRLSIEPMSVTLCFEVEGRDSAWICRELDRIGRLKVGYGVVHGRRVIRMVFVNADLAESDIDDAFGAILEVGERAPASDNMVAVGA